MYRVAEVFTSVQGEGPSVGLPCVFVRFAGCNLSCPFCDEVTKDAGAREVRLDELVTAVNGLVPAEARSLWRVVLTGGEPLLQVDRELVTELRLEGYDVALETNGTVRVDDESILSPMQEVVVSPKQHKIAPGVTMWASTLKVLVPFPGNIIRFDVGEWVRQIRDGRRDYNLALVLQPVTTNVGMVESHVKESLTLQRRWAEEYNERWRVIPQVHKMLGVQ